MKKKILFVICLLVGLLFINAGMNKFFNYMPVPEDLPETQVNMFMAMMQIGWLLPLVAIGEITGGVLLIVPRWRALAAIVLFPIIIGIMLTHFTVAKDGIPMALIIAAVIVWVIIENKERYKNLISG
jgi:uncharacterized membrane protein YphA (DoxX/SURF4 family)